MKVKLGNIAVLLNGDRGKNYPSQADITETDEIPFVNAGHLTGREISFEDMNYISREKYNQLSAGKFCKGDILYCLRGSLGKKALIKEDIEGAIASSLVIIRANEEIINKDYLMFALDSPVIREQLLKANNGSSQPNLSAASVKQYEFDLPDYKTQVKVVSKLIKLRSIIDARKQELLELDNLIKSRFVEIFGDPMTNSKGYELKSYGELFELNAGGTPSKQKPEYWDNGSISWIGSNMCQNTIIYGNDGNYITEDGLNHSSARMFPVDTVLIALVGATIGKTALLKFETTTNQNVLGVRGIRENGYTPEFVFYYTQGLYQKFLNIGDGGFSMASKGFISELPVPVIGLELQEQFTTFARQVDKLKFKVQKSLDEAQTLMNSLMQQYFG